MVRRLPRRGTLLLGLALLGGCGEPARPTTAEDGSEVGSAARAQVWLTTSDGDHRLASQPDLALEADSAALPITVLVDAGTRLQRITGFGAAVTGSAAGLLRRGMPAGDRVRLMRALFDPVEGIGLDFVRVAMGASDFSPRSYTYHDLAAGESDPELERFDIGPDRAEILPVLREARRINPALRVMATPWSAPAWMKTSGRLNGGSLRPDAYAAYARYFREFVRAYEREGVPIHAVSVQNEPRHEAAYPSMRMEPAEQAAFVRDHLGPTFAASGIATRILAWDHNWDDVDYPVQVLGDGGARRFVSGVAFHCYAGDVANQSRVHDAFPEQEIHFTECSGGAWSTDFGANLAWNMRHLVIGATRNWAGSVLLWNLALDPDHGPTNGGCADCRGVVTVDPATGGADFNVEYYALGHASKFVRQGAHRVASTAPGGPVETVAFLNPDRSRVLIAFNGADGPRTLQVREGGRGFRYSIPPGAAATFRWR